MRYVVIAVVLSALISTNVWAQKPKTKAPAKPASRPAAESVKYDSAPFDASVESLPLDYPGHNCRSIAVKLKTLNPEKSEFETTEAYEKRMALADFPLYCSVTLNSVLAFVVRPMLPGKYNADLKQMEFDYRPTGINAYYDGHAGDLIDNRVRSTETYQASNAFGRSVTVAKTTYDVCALGLQNKTGRLQSVRATLAGLEPEDARSLKEHVALLYVGTLAKPYIGKFGAHLEPSINSPTEAYLLGDNLIFELQAVWLFDRSTGRVYRKDLDVY